MSSWPDWPYATTSSEKVDVPAAARDVKKLATTENEKGKTEMNSKHMMMLACAAAFCGGVLAEETKNEVAANSQELS